MMRPGQGWARFDPPAGPSPDPRRPRPLRSLWRAAGLCYDYLGAVLAGSGLWTLGTLGLLAATGPFLARPLSPFGLLALLVMALGLSVLNAAVLGLAVAIADRDDPSLWHLYRGVRELGCRAAGLGLLGAALGALLAADATVLATRPQRLWQLAAVPFLYSLVALALLQVPAWPLLARQRLRPLAALRHSGLLVLDNPVYLGVTALILALLGLISTATAVPLVLFFPVLAAVSAVCAVDDLLAKYAL